ncbi:MAG: bifunctional diaminohydroxyphosphoribosylaminopyrimidine deaminase/5-amino-6-(5-phosphoribosylamino)uracil reductase RibD [Bacteroidales bacterium]|nr:bifunctional diaminohydroxyphosphoribosylaminopyrimidine deaminase/5-amino-6-(5-phosphoribosylamino)uracil reductase RibD [Bacteroidales bacterium]
MNETTCGLTADKNPVVTEEDKMYMRRALQLAACGRGRVSPNPMVGAVLVARGRIIGEGFHRRFGCPHAEVNAIGTVSETDRPLLTESSIYVTLEPCSHYGKTPPCAELLIKEGIPRIVVGALDPFEKVSGRGVRMLREAGREVITGVLDEECQSINVRFMTAHRRHRPYIELKWAETADGFIGSRDAEGNPGPVKVSDSLTQVLMHADRSMADAVMVGTGTALSDNPSLTLRHWPGRDPLRVTFDEHGRLRRDLKLFADGNVLVVPAGRTLAESVELLYKERGITSLIVEGGAALLNSFLDSGLWDSLRVETAPVILGGGVAAPVIPRKALLMNEERVRDHYIRTYRHL